MTIVEVVDSHQGFKVVTDRIESNNKRSLMWIIAGLTFFKASQAAGSISNNNPFRNLYQFFHFFFCFR
jgi:hypothetical protein